MNESASPSKDETAGKWIVLGIVAIGIFMATLDASIVNISLPKIGYYFKAPLGGLMEWIIIAYLIVIASLLLTLGRLSDIVGRKPLWITGLAVFTLSSASCGAAPSLIFLVISRAFQGIGGALIMSVSPAMVAHAFPAGERGRAMGLVAAFVAIGTSAGPTLGGVITHAFSWRWIFYINVPVGIVGIIASARLLSESVRLENAKKQFDPAGAVLLSLSMTLFMLGITFGQEAGWESSTIMVIFAVAVVLLIIFLMVERRSAAPIVDMSIFRNRLFSAALISSFLSFLSLFAVVFLMPFFLQDLLFLSPDRAGLLLTTVPLTISLVAPLSGWLSDRFGSRVLSSLGMTIASIGLFFLSRLTHETSISGIICPLVVAGLGQAMFFPPNNNAIMSSVPANRIGIAAGFLATVRVLGQGFSVALAGAIFTSLGGARAGLMLAQNKEQPPLFLQHTFVHAFRVAMLSCMIIAGIGIFTSLARGRSQPQGK